MIKKAIILSAGQGSRLLPLTADRPKCLIDFAGKTLLEWQIEMLHGAGVAEFHIVTGFMTELVEEELNRLGAQYTGLHAHFNPFYKVADNLGSCWIVRHLMHDDFFILNGDTLVSQSIVETAQNQEAWPIAVTVDVKPAYDSDDMRVNRQGDRLTAIGKTLSTEQSNAESIGFLGFRGEGVDLFREQVRATMRTSAGVENWYLKVIDSLAPTGKVGTTNIEGMEWAEVDFLNDIEIAVQLARRWQGIA